jgi:3-hydroxyacyl-[acyl-carrier-protein] dehydratase
MAKPLLNFEEVKSLLKQRFPMLMVDTVVTLEPGQSIRATKNVTGSEIQFLGHFPEQAIMPGTLMVEALGQVACILFSKTTGIGMEKEEFLVLGSIDGMRFLQPVLPGDRMDIEVRFVKLLDTMALVEGTVSVDGIVVMKGRLGFARRKL